MQKKKRKKRLRIGRLFLLLFILGAISFACVKFVDVPIRTITITGNEILSDNDVIKQADLEDYPSYFSVFSFVIKNKLKKNPYVYDAKVSKGLLSINIKIIERKILYVKRQTNEKVTESTMIKDDGKIVCAPYLIGDVPENKKLKFIKAMNKLDKDIICQMSEIKHDPNDIDSDRYYVYMNDGNSVYLTVNKFEKLNKYNKILENIGKQNGTLYLDYGDYFELK